MIFCSKCIKVNNIINKFLFAREDFNPEMILLQPGFTYSTCRLFTKKKQNRIPKTQKIRRHQVHLSKRSRQELLSTWYGLWCVSWKTAPDKALDHNPFTFALMMDINKDLAQWSSYVLDKKFRDTITHNEHESFPRINNLLMNYTRPLLKNLVYAKNILFLEITFWMLILKTWN